MNWDSFVPDLLVGALTGVAVGFVLLGVERRRAEQRKKLDAEYKGAAVVDLARLVLPHKLTYGTSDSSFCVDRSQLDGLVEAVGRLDKVNMPGGVSPSLNWAIRVADVADEVDYRARALGKEVGVWQRGPAGTESSLVEVIWTVAGRGPAHPDAWRSEVSESLSSGAGRGDSRHDALLLLIEDYLRTRWLLEAHRAAFLDSDGIWRGKEWAALLAKTQGAPRNPFVRFARWCRYKQAVKEIEKLAFEEARKHIDKVHRILYQ